MGVSNPLKDLDKDQIRVATHMDGPAMVIAGAGSGKTRALIQRVAHLVSKGVDPERILATTFTRKAAGEIRERLLRFGVPCEDKPKKKLGVRVGTLHSTAYEILKSSDMFAFWEPNNDFPRVLAKEIIVAEYGGLSLGPVSAERFLQFMSLAKNYARSPEDEGMLYDSWFGQERFELHADALRLMYRRFEDERHERQLLTYDDMLLDAWRVLSEDDAAREKWQARFDHVLVDEAQDTNFVQFCIVETLSEQHRNYMIVGDPFQSIYSWRGAYPVYMRDFTGRFPEATVYEMFRNYRCARSVLHRANRVIANSATAGFDTLRLEPVRTKEGGVVHRECSDEQDQAKWVARQIRTRMNRGALPGDFAILYRARRIGKLFEYTLERANVPSKRLDGKPFYERVAIKTMVSCLALVEHPDWIEAGCFALDSVKFIGPATLTKLRSAPGEDFLEKGAWIGSKPRGLRIQARQCDNIAQFVKTIRACEGMPPDAALLKIVAGINFLSNFDKKKLEKDEYRGHDVDGSSPEEKVLRDDIEALHKRTKDFKTIDAFVEHATALAGQKEEEHVGNRVALSTIHRVKGLEFPHVYLVSAVEGILPHKKSIEVEADYPEAVDEERRLFYVASTRAKESLVVVTPRQSITFEVTEKSRFVKEAGLAVGEDDQEVEGG